MKLRIFFLLIYFIFLNQCAQASEWQHLTKGLSYKKIEVTDLNTTTTLHAFKASPHELSIKPIFDQQKTTIKQLAKKNNALLAINANFFGKDGVVLGLVKKDKQIINPKKNVSWWSVFCLHDDQPSIVHSSKVQDGYCHQAIQSGPRLVVNGQVPKLKEESSRKTAIGINDKGDVIFVVSTAPISIHKLAEVFKKSEKAGGLNCPNALNLDGGSSTQLYAQVDDFNLEVQSFVGVPVGLAVFPK